MTSRRILIPLDQSEFSLKIVAALQKFVSPEDTEIILFHALDYQPALQGDSFDLYQSGLGGEEHMTPYPVRSDLPDTDPGSQYGSMQALQANIENSLYRQGRGLLQAGYKLSTAVRFGDPAVEIVQVVKDYKVDFIAMTTHAREGLARWLVGSVAEQVVHQVNIPVLLLHP